LTPVSFDSDTKQAIYSLFLFPHENLEESDEGLEYGKTRLAAAASELAAAFEQLLTRMEGAKASMAALAALVGFDPAASLGKRQSAFANAAEYASREERPEYDKGAGIGLGRTLASDEWEHPPLPITIGECESIATDALPGWAVQPATLLIQGPLPGEPTGVGTLPSIPSGNFGVPLLSTLMSKVKCNQDQLVKTRRNNLE